MKIAIFNWRDIKNPKSGGAEVLTHEIAKRLIEKGHEVIYFTSYFKGAKKKEIIDGVKIIRDGEPDIRAGFSSVHFKAYTYYIKKLKRNVDLVIDEVHGMPFFTPLYVKERKIVLQCEVAKDIWDKMFKFPWNKIGKLMERSYFLLYRNMHFLTISDSTKKDIIIYGISSHKVTVLPMGFNKKKIPTSKKEKNPTLVFVARLNKMKGIEDALRALQMVKKNIPTVRLWIIGRGEVAYVNYLKSLSKKLDIENNILFWDFVSEKKKFTLMAKAHFLISPSIREGFGLTVPEAASVGTPAIVYNVPGLKDTINGKNGIKVMNNTYGSLAKAITGAFNDKKSYPQMRKNAMQESKKYNWNNTVNKFLEVTTS